MFFSVINPLYLKHTQSQAGQLINRFKDSISTVCSRNTKAKSRWNGNYPWVLEGYTKAISER